MLAASPRGLDVGVQDNTHGWMKIRAEMGTGGAVNASLTVSSSAHESLRAAVPEMLSFLGGEAVGVRRIAVHAFGGGASLEGDGGAGGRSQAGAGMNSQSGAGPNSQPDSKPDSQPGRASGVDATADAGPGPRAAASAVEMTSGVLGQGLAAAPTYLASGVGAYGLNGGRLGGWLNVSA
jgi:hypothetical protein